MTHPLLSRAHLEALLVLCLIAHEEAVSAASTPEETRAAAHLWIDGVLAEERRSRRAARAISYAQRTRILERDGFRCRRCGTGPQDERLVVDHVVPVVLGGGSDDSNLQTLCEPCNQGKAGRAPHPHDLETR